MCQKTICIIMFKNENNLGSTAIAGVHHRRSVDICITGTRKQTHEHLTKKQRAHIKILLSWCVICIHILVVIIDAY